MPTELLQQRLQENPPLNRFKYIAKMYGEKHPDVVLNTFILLADTVGIERPLGEYEWAAAASSADPDKEATARALRTGQAVDMESRRLGWAYLLDSALADLGKDPRMQHGREADVLWPWLARELVRMKRDHRGEYESGEYSSRVRGKGSALALWQQQNRIDLGQWRLADALDALEDFEVEQRGVPQGEVIYEFRDGWAIQRLTTPDQLKVEGEVMQHCVGNYCSQVEDGEVEILSLRDPKGKPHVTAEHRPSLNRFVQVKGKQNHDPIPEYRKRIEEFAAAAGINASEGLTPQEYKAAYDYGVTLGEELWHRVSENLLVGAKHGSSLAELDDPPHEVESYDVIEACPTVFKADSVDYDDAGLDGAIAEAAEEGVNAAWGEGVDRARDDLDAVIEEVVQIVRDAIEEGEDEDSIDVDFEVNSALEASRIPWGPADVQYAIDEVVARI